MFCTRCGLEMADDAAFCSRCGQPTGVPPVARVTPPRRLSRPMHEKKIAGVCAGFARYLDVDPTLMRIIWLVVALTTGVGFIAYIIAWIAMPRDEQVTGFPVAQRT
jgi:phage shock protein C